MSKKNKHAKILKKGKSIMSVDTNIKLPLWVRSESVLKVIGKSVGVPFSFGTINQRPYHEKNPSDNLNPWFLKFNSSGDSYIKSKPVDYASSAVDFLFQDISGSLHKWLFFHETEDEDFKLLNPNQSAMSVAIGRRLIQFFGGEIQYCDYTSNSDYKVSQRLALYPKKKTYQTSDDRWYQFQNTLKSFPILSLEEMDFAVKEGGCSQRDQNFMDSLKTMKEKKNLEECLPPSLIIKNKSKI